MVGAEEFKLVNFHFELEGMRLGLWFIVFLIWFWNVLVGLDVGIWKLFLSTTLPPLTVPNTLGWNLRNRQGDIHYNRIGICFQTTTYFFRLLYPIITKKCVKICK
jgi:hypothetical protein